MASSFSWHRRSSCARSTSVPTGGGTGSVLRPRSGSGSPGRAAAGSAAGNAAGNAPGSAAGSAVGRAAGKVAGRAAGSGARCCSGDALRLGPRLGTNSAAATRSVGAPSSSAAASLVPVA